MLGLGLQEVGVPKEALVAQVRGRKHAIWTNLTCTRAMQGKIGKHIDSKYEQWAMAGDMSQIKKLLLAEGSMGKEEQDAVRKYVGDRTAVARTPACSVQTMVIALAERSQLRQEQEDPRIVNQLVHVNGPSGATDVDKVRGAVKSGESIGNGRLALLTSQTIPARR